MQISNSNNRVSNNFLEREFYSRSFNAPESHYLDDKVIEAIQLIRDYYGVPVIINSTYRTVEHNTLVGGASNSQHLYGKAIDFHFDDSDYLDVYYKDIISQGELYHKLKAIEVNGFGMYDNFMHIDTRSNAAFWDNSKKKA